MDILIVYQNVIIHSPAVTLPLMVPFPVYTSTVILYEVVGSNPPITTLESVVVTLLMSRDTLFSDEGQ